MFDFLLSCSYSNTVCKKIMTCHHSIVTKNEQVWPLMCGDTISPLTVDYTQTTGIDGNLPNQDIA